MPIPTDAQACAGNYLMGRVKLHGLPIRIENVRGSYREGTALDGTQWRTRLAAHYGYFFGTCGADGDAVDVFVGLFPESESVWVVNQRHVGVKSGFDEHKVMLGFHTEQQARDAYTYSFDSGWTGLMSIVPASLTQLKWWLKYGNHKVPFLAENLPYDGETMMDKVLWDSNAQPTTTSFGHIMYGLRVHDADAGLLLDALTVQDLMTDPDIEAVPIYDALVVEVASMQRKMTLLQSTMEAAGATVKPLEMTIADPVKARGVLQVMVLFTMSDGQTVSIWFHNPDTTPAKLTPMDELISWKWMINKKDVTIVVAPERGRDLNVREVSRRVMRLVEKNSEAFARANAKAGERAEITEALKTEIAGLEDTLSGLQRQIDVAKVENEARDVTPLVEPIATRAETENIVPDGNQFDGLRQFLAETDQLTAQANALGLKFKTPEQYMESANSGETETADSVQVQEQKLKECLSKIADVTSGGIRPEKIVGTGGINKKARAISYLKGQVSKLTLSLSHGGFWIDGNVSNYNYALKILIDGKPSELAVSDLEFKQEDFPAQIDRSADISEFIAAGFKRVDDNDYVRVSKDGEAKYQFNIRVTEEGFVVRLTVGFDGGITGAASEVGKTADASEAVAMVDSDLAKRTEKPAQKIEPESYPLVIVDAAYKFTSATDAFKELVADSIAETEYSPFATAKAMDMKAKDLGATVAWDVSTAVLDSASEGSSCSDQVVDGCAKDSAGEEGEDFDENAEWDATPEEDADEPVLDGDFKGHPFRGNQHKKASRESGTAVNSSIRAKHAERTGSAKDAAKAHKAAHYAHMAAGVSATGKAKKYHKIMAKFHGSRSGVVMDSVDAPLFTWMLDDAGESQTAIGVISKDGDVKGRAHIVGDGKAMVFVGAEGLDRIQYPNGRAATWSEDDTDLMLETLLVTPLDRATEPVETDVSLLNAADKLVSKEAIMSDDPQAIEKLDAKLTALRMRQEFMKKANKLLKNGDDAGLLAMGISQYQIDNLKKPDFAGRTGFADYLLTNNNGVISSTRKRLDAMIAAAQKEAAAPEPVIETRDQRDVETDPERVAIVDPVEPLVAAEIEPVVPTVVERVAIPVSEDPAGVVDPIKAVDTAYLQTFVDGTADMFAADILERLEPMFTKYEADAAMMELLNQAAQAYSDAAVKAAQEALAG
nr:hypothetical protein [uncultured Rhodoferax sp.]